MDSQSSIPSKYQITLTPDQLDGLFGLAVIGKIMASDMKTLVVASMTGVTMLKPKQISGIEEILLMLGGQHQIESEDLDDIENAAKNMTERVFKKINSTVPVLAQLAKLHTTHHGIEVGPFNEAIIQKAMRGET